MPTPTGGLPVEPASPANQNPTPLENPVLPPDIDAFMAKRREKPETPKEKPKAKVEAPKAEKPAEEPKESQEDVITDPLLRSLADVDPDDTSSKKEDDVSKKSAEDDKSQKSVDADIDLPEGPLKGKDAESRVREAFVKQKKTLTAKIKDLEAKLASKGAAEVPEDIKSTISRYEQETVALKKQLEDQEKYVQIANVEMSEVYRQQVKAPKEALKGDILRIARENGGEDAGVSANDIYKAIQLGDRQELNQVLSKLDEASRAEVVLLAKDFRTIQTADKALRENAKVAFEELTRVEQAKQSEMTIKVKEAYEAMVEKNIKAVEASKEFSPLFQKVDGEDDWNEAVDEANAFGDRLRSIHPSKLSVGDLAALVSETRLAHVLKVRNRRLTAEVARLARRLKGKNAATPTMGGSQSPAPRSNSDSPPSPEEYFARLRSRTK